MGTHTGQRFGDYRLIRSLGEGTFGDVYYAEHSHQKTPAAVKVFKTKLTPDKFKSFINEVRTVLLRHPHIVPVIDFGIREDDIGYLVMEYAPNRTLLASHPRGTRLPLSTIVTYIGQIAEALQFAHDNRLIHRDVKPANVLVGAGNNLLLSDFGIAVVAHSPGSQGIEDKSGTATYMAPEQWKGKPLPASDQYALGIMVYEWLCGEPPFTGNTLQLQYQHTTVPAPPLHEKEQTISSEVEQVVLTALAKDPEQRFTSVQVFAQALERAYQSQLSLASSSTQMIAPPAADPGSSPVIQPPIASIVPQNPRLSPFSKGAIIDGRFEVGPKLHDYSNQKETVYELRQLEAPFSPCVMRELTISPDTSAEDRETVRKRWNEGIECLRNLNHPSIPSLVFAFQAYGNYYLVMEYVSKRPVEALLRENKGPLGEEQVIQWIMQVCEVVSYLHSCSPPIILELEPDDIGITSENSVCLFDVGAALGLVSYSPPPKRNIMRKLPVLTFFSPEAVGIRTSPRSMPIQIDARSDIYSLGAIIYLLLTYSEPDPIQTPEPGSIVAKNPRLHAVQVGNQTVCPIEQVIIKAMQQSPDMRFQNVNAMRTALTYCLTTIQS